MSTASTARRRLGFLMATPAVLGALGVAALEGSRALSLPWVESARAVPGSLGEALRIGDFEAAFQHLRSGQAPNQLIAFRDEELTSNREIQIAPLLIAIATRSDNSVMMLLTAGTRLDAPTNRYARCLAQRVGSEAITRVLERASGPGAPAVACPDVTGAPDALLLPYAE